MSAGQALPKAGLLNIASTVAPASSWWQILAFLAAGGVALESCPGADLAVLAPLVGVAVLALPGASAVPVVQALLTAGLSLVSSKVATARSCW